MALVFIITIFTVILAVILSYFGIFREPPLTSDELAGKTVIITGASAGIGEEIAYHYAQAGASVLLVARRKTALEEVAKRCIEYGAKNAVVLPADMGLEEDISKILLQFNKIFPAVKLDHLILNHKLENRIGPWKGTSANLTELEKIVRVNFYGYVKVLSQLMPLLEASGGSVGIVSSASGRSNTPYLISYSASKHALDGFFGGLSLELQASKSNISLTYCTLGLIETSNMRKELGTFSFKNLNMMSAASSSDTALAVITAVTRRRRELYYPWLQTKVPLLFQFWFPELLDKICAFVMKAEYE